MLHTCVVCDLVELFTTWALEAVPDVRLEMPIDADLNLNLAPFFAGARALSVTVEGEDWKVAVWMVSELPRRRTVVCTEHTNVLEPSAALSHMLHAPQVQTLAIPLGLLNITALIHRWPRLTHLSVLIYETKMFPWLPAQSREGQPRFSWTSLECLRALPPLETLELHVHAASVSNPLALEDAKELKACLSALRDCVPREVRVHGFPADVASQMPICDDDEPRVVFH